MAAKDKCVDMLADDDNWDNDFATAISPSALHLPHLKPQDNFGGLLSADKLKAFASITDPRNDSESYDDDFEGELLTIKGPRQFADFELQEQTIRPMSRKKSDKYAEPMKQQQQQSQQLPAKSSPRKTTHSRNPSRPKSPSKPQLGPGRFEIPAPPDLAYREQNTEDYSDLFLENDSVFNDNELNPFVKKVCSVLVFDSLADTTRPILLSSFILRILQVCLVRHSHPWQGAQGGHLARNCAPPYCQIAQCEEPGRPSRYKSLPKTRATRTSLTSSDPRMRSQRGKRATGARRTAA